MPSPNHTSAQPPNQTPNRPPVPDVLIVSYRRADLLARCLETVAAHLPTAWVRVWDNRSDGTPAVRELADHRPEVDWVFCDDNVGFAAAVNGLMRRVTAPTALLLNPDAALLSDLDRTRRTLADDPQVAAAGPNIAEAGQRVWDNAHREPTWVRHLVSYAGWDERVRRFAPVSMAYRDRPIDVSGYLTGAALLISMDSWRAVGEFDERYFLYGEEADWCHRARRRGLRLVSVGEPGVEHAAAGTVSDEVRARGRSDVLLAQSRVRYIRDQQGATAARAYRAGAAVLERTQRSKRRVRAAERAAGFTPAARPPAPDIIVTTPTLGFGGAERQRVVLVNGLAAAGERVQLRAVQGFGPLAADLSGAVQRVAAPYTQVSRDAGRCTLLVTGTSRIELAFGLAWRTANLPHGRWVVANHQPAEADRPVFPAPVAAPMCLADGMIYLSVDHREAHRRHQRLDRGRWWIVPNGIDVEAVAGPHRPRPPRQPRPGPIRLVTASRLAAVKQVDLLVGAVGEGLDDLDWTLDVWGEGPDRDALTAAVAGLPPAVADRVRLRGWCADVPGMLREADVFCLPSRAEAQPMTVLEAMACGTAVVAHPVAAVPEMLQDGLAGYLVSPPTLQRWREVLREVVTDDAGRRRTVARAADRVRQRYSLEAMIEGYRRVRDEAVGDAGRHRRLVSDR